MPSHILIGPMGVGKTSVGKELAQKLGAQYHDTDEMVERSSSRTISEIFIEDGEEEFRALEAKALREGLTCEGVLSLGGGACLATEAQILIKNSHAQVIFLDISLKEVSSRVGFDSARPLLAINPRSQWQNLMDARRPIYEDLADKTILVDGKSVENIVAEIVGAS